MNCFEIKAEKTVKGISLKNAGRLEEAYVCLKEAADAGNPLAMHTIGNLYLYHCFHSREKPVLKLTMMPWDKQTQMVPDYSAAFDWYLRAAKAGFSDAMCNVGVMLYHGNGTAKDQESAKTWLLKSAKEGNTYAVKALKDLFQMDFSVPVSDAQYDSLLDAFCKAVESNDPAAQDLFGACALGNDKQLCRLGYRLAVGRYHIKGAYGKYAFPNKSNGRTCAPAQYVRAGWITILIVNRSAFPEPEPYISFQGGCDPVPVCNCVLEGKVRYDPTDFGWFREDNLPDATMYRLKLIGARGDSQKIKDVLSFSDTHITNTEELFEAFSPCDDEALFIDGGEKEFSVEICHLCAGKAKALLRYTVGGWDQGDFVTPVPDVRCL